MENILEASQNANLGRESHSPALDRQEKQNMKPVGSSGVALWTCIILGVSSLLPWNLFITAYGYFSYKFRHINESESGNSTATALSESFMMYFTVAGTVSGTVGSITSIFLRLWLSLNVLMISGHLLVSLSLAVSIAFSFVNTDDWQTGFLWFNVLLILISQVGCALIAGGVFSIAALLSEKRFTNAVVSAQAFAGIFTAIINIISTAVGSSGRPSLIGGVYFAMALVFMLGSLGMFFHMVRDTYVQYYITKPGRAKSDDVEPLMVDPQVDNEDDCAINRVMDRTVGGSRFWNIVKKTFYHGFILTIVMLTTLLCFPSLTSLVRSTAPSSSTWQTYFTPVACFLVFNTVDFIGRCIGNFVYWPKPGHALIGFFAVLRFGFLILFLFCNIPPYTKTNVFSDDFYFVIFVILFGLTNGYLANLAATYLPYDLSEHDREKAGPITIFYLSIGVLTGSIASLFIVRIIIGHW